MKFIITLLISCVISILCGCQTGKENQRRSEIEVTLHPISYSPLISSVTNTWLIKDVSQRDGVPEGASIGPRGVYFPNGMTPELKKWKENYVAQVDFVVRVKNISDKTYRFFEEWNSWGYYNLKIVFGDGSHEYFVVKKPGNWYRNFASWHNLAPGESFQIPVAIVDHIWSGLSQVKAHTNEILSVRALYEQYKIGIGPEENYWYGTQSSQYYSASKLLPRFGFKKDDSFITKDVEYAQPPTGNCTDPDDITIDTGSL